MKGMPCLNQHAIVILLFLNRMSEKILWEGFILSHSLQGSNHHCVEIIAVCLVLASYIMSPGNGDSDRK